MTVIIERPHEIINKFAKDINTSYVLRERRLIAYLSYLGQSFRDIAKVIDPECEVTVSALMLRHPSKEIAVLEKDVEKRLTKKKI